MSADQGKSLSDSVLGRTLSEITKYIASFALIAYVAGFIITNLYLGSLGIVNLNLLRARYIVSGTLFVGFFGTIVFLLYGLFHVLRREYKTNLSLVFNAAWYSMNRVGTVMFAVAAISVLAGSVNSPPLGIPQLTPMTPLSSWFDQGLVNSLITATRWLIVIMIMFSLLIIIVLIILLVVNPKTNDGVREPRKKQIKEFFRLFAKEIKARSLSKILIYGLVFFAFIFLIEMLSSLLIYIGTGKQSNVNVSSSSLISGGWTRFFVGLIVIYGIAATILLFFRMLPPNSSKSQDESISDPTEKYSFWVGLVAIATMVIVPVYALGIYPNLPQQVGGGSLVKVEVISSDQTLNQKFTDPQIETYMIDQAPDSLLIFVVEKTSPSSEVVEVMNSQVKGLIYPPNP
jgi:hypothetical protein